MNEWMKNDGKKGWIRKERNEELKELKKERIYLMKKCKEKR